MEKMVPTLGYWDMRGLAQPIRYLLKYNGIQFNDQRYPFGGTTSSEEVRKYWISDKSNLGLDFPNLPFYMDANVKVGSNQPLYLIIY
jgi:glutathione S-transferase